MATLTAGQKLNAKRTANDKLQREVNDIAAAPAYILAGWVHRFIRAIAYSAHAEYPQFNNHWQNWKLVRLKRSVTTKAGQAFVEGDFALMSNSANKDQQRRQFRTVYSIRNGVDTSIALADIDLIA